jgi:hypothetical protein
MAGALGDGPCPRLVFAPRSARARALGRRARAVLTFLQVLILHHFLLVGADLGSYATAASPRMLLGMRRARRVSADRCGMGR